MSYRLPFNGDYSRSRGFIPGTHFGIDFNTPPDTALVAIGDGQVIYTANEEGGLGNTVTIRLDGGPKVGYGHLSRIDVQVGQRVAQGQQIGLSGGGAWQPGHGSSTGPHLHLWMGEATVPPGVVDPAPLISSTPSVPSQGELTLTPEEEAKLGQWEQDTRKIVNDFTERTHQTLKSEIIAGNDQIVALLNEILTELKK